MSFLTDNLSGVDWREFFETKAGWVFKTQAENQLVLCSFHSEHTPSLSVNIRTSRYKCHACSEKGDAISLLKTQGLSDAEAIAELKRFFNITDRPAPAPVTLVVNRPVLPKDDARIQAWHKRLLANPDRLMWLKQKRGIDPETVRRFELGFVLEADSENPMHHGRYSLPVRTKDGVASIKMYAPDHEETGAPKQVHAEKGQITALYPESVLDSSDRILLCEGEFDALLGNQLGYAAVTSTGGANSWKEGWTEQLRDKEVVIVYDCDDAGRKGATKVAEAIKEVARQIVVVDLGLDKPGGDVSDFFLESGGTVETLNTLIASTRPYFTRGDVEVTANDVLRNARSMRAVVAAAIRENVGNDEDKLFKFRAAGESVFDFFVNFGTFYIDKEKSEQFGDRRSITYFFNRTTKDLFTIDSLKFQSLLEEHSYLNPRQPEFEKMLEYIHMRAIRGGAERVSVYRVAHYDPDTKRAYIFRGNNRMFVLNGRDEPHEADNGDDGVLFDKGTSTQSWDADFQYDGVPMMTMFDDVNIDAEDTDMTSEQIRLLLTVFAIAMAFPDIQPTRLVPIFVGQHGSGKTFVSRKIGRLWCGPDWQVDSIEVNKEDDFMHLMTSNYIVCADNLDNRIPWVQDALSKVATGAKISRRMLYTDNEVWSANISSFLMLTSREPRWLKREDVVQRMLPVHIRKRTEDFLPELVLMQQENALRRPRMGHLLRVANDVVRQLREGATPERSVLRIGDFAFIGGLIARTLGKKELFDASVLALRNEQGRFMAEDHPLIDALAEWMAQGANRKTSAIGITELYDQLAIISQWNERRGVRTWQTMKTHLDNMKEELFKIFGPYYVYRDSQTKQWAIRFGQEPDEEHDKLVGDTGDLPF